MMEYWDHWCSIWLKNNMVHGIKKPRIENTSTENLKNCKFGLRPAGDRPRRARCCFPLKSGKITFILSEDYAAPRNLYPLSYYGHPCYALGTIRSSVQTLDQTIETGVLKYWDDAKLGQYARLVIFRTLFHDSNIPSFHVGGIRSGSLKATKFQNIIGIPRRFL